VGRQGTDHGAVLFRRCDTCDIDRLVIGLPTRLRKGNGRDNSRADLVVLYCDLGRLQEGLAALESAIAHPITPVWWSADGITDGRSSADVAGKSGQS
jgi:hypothetical protein